MNDYKQVTVPYFYQLDNASGQGYRECLSSSCAMLAAFRGKVRSDDEYNVIRRRYGDSTNIQAQLMALKSLGLRPDFRTDGNADSIRRIISEGRPLATGWLHKGHVTRPSGGGHWTVVIGYTPSYTIHHDPYGEANLVNGGYDNHSQGDNIYYSFKNFIPRWCPDGPNKGWYIAC